MELDFTIQEVQADNQGSAGIGVPEEAKDSQQKAEEEEEKAAKDAKAKKWWRLCLHLVCRESLSGDGVALKTEEDTIFA